MTSTSQRRSSSDVPPIDPEALRSGVWFYDRPSGSLERETVVAESGLRWLYHTLVGLLLSRLVLARRWPSALYGWYQSSRFSHRKIAGFVEDLSIDMSESRRSLGEFRSFNDFFTRKLKPEARPLQGDSDLLLSPADGRVWAIQTIDRGTVLPIKGREFQIDTLLGRPELAQSFMGGSVVCVRLCPADYHRYHFPDDGIPGLAWQIRGRYHSVNPLALESGLHIFDGNQRDVTLFESNNFGRLALIEVGAMFVGQIVQTYAPNQPVKRGSEKGFFTFGASTTVMLIEPGRVILDQDLLDHSRAGLETRLLMGTRIGRRST